MFLPPMKYSVVTFTLPEKRMILHTARMSWAYHKQRMGSGDTHINKGQEWPDKLAGTAGEFAFCKHFNVWPRLKETTAVDLIFMGFRIDVKSSTYKDCNLFLPKYLDRSKPPDYYYLVHVDQKSWECKMIGFSHSSTILNPKAFHTHHPITGKPFKKPGYFLLRESLTPQLTERQTRA